MVTISFRFIHTCANPVCGVQASNVLMRLIKYEHEACCYICSCMVDAEGWQVLLNGAVGSATDFFPPETRNKVSVLNEVIQLNTLHSRMLYVSPFADVTRTLRRHC